MKTVAPSKKSLHLTLDASDVAAIVNGQANTIKADVHVFGNAGDVFYLSATDARITFRERVTSNAITTVTCTESGSNNIGIDVRVDQSSDLSNVNATIKVHAAQNFIHDDIRDKNGTLVTGWNEATLTASWLYTMPSEWYYYSGSDLYEADGSGGWSNVSTSMPITYDSGTAVLSMPFASFLQNNTLKEFMFRPALAGSRDWWWGYVWYSEAETTLVYADTTIYWFDVLEDPNDPDSYLSFIFDETAWPVTAVPRLRAWMKVVSAGMQVYARLYDMTAAAAVVGSELFCNEATRTCQTSNPIALVNGHEYRLQVAHNWSDSGMVYVGSGPLLRNA